MFQFNSNPLQLNLDYNIPDATHPKEEYNEETVVAGSSSSFSDVVYNYNTNTSFSSFDSGAELFGMSRLPDGGQLYPVEQPGMCAVDSFNTVPHYNRPESSSSASSFQSSLPLLTPEEEQYIDALLLNMPCDVPQPPPSASTDAISPVNFDHSTSPIPTAFGQEYIDPRLTHMPYASAQALRTGVTALMHPNQLHAHRMGEDPAAPMYNTQGEPETDADKMGGGTVPVTYNVGGATVRATYNLNTFIATYPSTSVVYGVSAPGQAPARAIMTTTSTSAHVEGPRSAPAVAPPAPAKKPAKKRSRSRKTKSSLSTTRKHVKASAPTSKVPCLFPGCNRLFYDEKTRQRHASTHDGTRPGFFCPGMYLPRVDCAKCNCNETGYTREDALVRHLKSVEPFNPCVLEAERLGWSANVKGSAKNLRGYRPVKPVIMNADAGAES